MKRRTTRRTTRLTVGDGTRIAYRDRPGLSPGPGPEPSVLLLHGLAGHLGEWDDLAGRLESSGRRVVSYDARGHGESTRRPASVTRAAHVEDAATLLRELDLAPAILVGQSLGGHTAMLLAADHPGLVHSLVLVEAGPAGRSARSCPARSRAGWTAGPFPSRPWRRRRPSSATRHGREGSRSTRTAFVRASTVTRWSGR
nr:alpha/beta hydrolase [Streptomyces canus]